MKTVLSNAIFASFLLSTAVACTHTLSILGSTQSVVFAAIGETSIASKSPIQTIEAYTGEKYSQGDCEKKDIYESADESVVHACELVEGV